MQSSKATQRDNRHNSFGKIINMACGAMLVGMLAACGGGGTSIGNGGGGFSATDLNGFWEITEIPTVGGQLQPADTYVYQIIQSGGQVSIVDDQGHLIPATLVGDTLGWQADALENADGSVVSYSASVQATSSALADGTSSGVRSDSFGNLSFESTFSAVPLEMNVDLSNPLANISIGGGRSGHILNGNHADLFSFSLPSPKTLHIFSLGMVDTVGILMDANGNVIGHNDDGSFHQESDFHINTEQLPAGDYYILVHGYAAADTGVYKVWVQQIL